jgi:hypothetical protein
MSTRQRPRPPSVERRERFGRYCSSRQADQEQGRVPRRGTRRRAPSRPARATSPSGSHRHDAGSTGRPVRPPPACRGRACRGWLEVGERTCEVPGPARKRRSRVITGRGGVLAWHAVAFAISGPGGFWRLVGVLARSRRRKCAAHVPIGGQEAAHSVGGFASWAGTTAPVDSIRLGCGGGQDLQVGADPHGRAGQPGRVVGEAARVQQGGQQLQ